MPNIFFVKEKILNVYIFITIFLILTFLLLIMFYEYEEYLDYYGELNNDYLIILVEKENISKISNKLLINNEIKKCKIDKISKNYIVNTDYKLYHEVYYKCDLENLIDTYIFNIKISEGNTTLFKKIKNTF